MKIADYQYITINHVKLAYLDSGGNGQPLLLLHGFSSFSYTWEQLIAELGGNWRFIRPDLKGFGYSEKIADAHLSPFDQALLVEEFIRQLDLRNLVLAGHSMGGAVGLICMLAEDIGKRVSRVILLDSAGIFQQVPAFVEDIALTSARNPLFRFANEDLMAYLVLKEVYYDESAISETTVKAYGEVLRLPGARETLIAAAHQLAIANVKSFQENIRRLTQPVLIIWGEEDRIIDVEDAFLFHDRWPGSTLRILPCCGHSPQEEQPRQTAALIKEFLTASGPGSVSVPAVKTAAAPLPLNSPLTLRELKMRRLVDHWSLGALLLIVSLKFLQFWKKLGFKAEENGWRKATGIFLRNEYSKFVLANFRLYYYLPDKIPENFDLAKQKLIDRLAEFLRRQKAFHWSVVLGIFRVGRRKVYFTDIVEVWFDHDGKLLGMEPHFDTTRDTFSFLSPAQVALALDRIIKYYNDLRNVNDARRPVLLYRLLWQWTYREKGLSLSCRQELRHLIDRVLTATMLQCEVLAPDPATLTRSRLTTPNLKNRKHPGLGLLNIISRFTADFKEVDLWFQYHHVPVDGMPMQEIMEQLKHDWGCAGKMLYPAYGSPAAQPEIFYFGNRVFRARVYVNFEKLLALRHDLNNRYYQQMGGPATIASMLIWGLGKSRYFRDSKFLFPVDVGTMVEYPKERNLSLIFIRPSRFFEPTNPLDGFLRFEREFNQRLFATRMGKSESYEVLELYSMIHPAFYYLARYLMPKAMGEIVGTTGLSVIRNAEMFVSPLSDLQSKGFMAVGNLAVPTEDGRTAGAVSFCGSREQVRHYIEAVNSLAKNYYRFLGLPDPEAEKTAEAEEKP